MSKEKKSGNLLELPKDIKTIFVVSEELNSKDLTEIQVEDDFTKFESMNSNVFKPDKDCPYQKLKEAVKENLGLAHTSELEPEQEEAEFHDIS